MACVVFTVKIKYVEGNMSRGMCRGEYVEVNMTRGIRAGEYILHCLLLLSAIVSALHSPVTIKTATNFLDS